MIKRSGINSHLYKNNKLDAEITLVTKKKTEYTLFLEKTDAVALLKMTRKKIAPKRSLIVIKQSFNESGI